MLTYLVWACYAYAAIWLVASVLFYCLGRLCKGPDPSMAPPSAWMAALTGLVWPVALVALVILLWRSFRPLWASVNRQR